MAKSEVVVVGDSLGAVAEPGVSLHQLCRHAVPVLLEGFAVPGRNHDIHASWPTVQQGHASQPLHLLDPLCGGIKQWKKTLKGLPYARTTMLSPEEEGTGEGVDAGGNVIQHRQQQLVDPELLGHKLLGVLDEGKHSTRFLIDFLVNVRQATGSPLLGLLEGVLARGLVVWVSPLFLLLGQPLSG